MYNFFFFCKNVLCSIAQCACCPNNPSLASPSLPDLSLVYRLHLECGKLINLYDWMQAFFSVATEGEEDIKEEQEKLLQ